MLQSYVVQSLHSLAKLFLANAAFLTNVGILSHDFVLDVGEEVSLPLGPVVKQLRLA